MSVRRLAILFVLALATITFAFWLSTQRYLPRDADFGARVLGGLEPDLDAIDKVKVVGPGGRTLVTLARSDGRWRVVERGYPAEATRVKRLLLALADLRVRERKTSEPASYAALGVDDPHGAHATGVLLELTGPVRSHALIVGRNAGDSSATYVRIPTEPQALEAHPALEVERDPQQWLARTLVDVAAERVQAVEIARNDGPSWSASRDSRQQAEFAGAGVAAALANLEFTDVRPSGEIVAAGAPHVATIATFDGLVLTVRGYATGEQRWVEVDARFDAALAARFPPAAADAAVAPGAEQVASDAQRLADTANGWRYEIPAWKFDALFRPRVETLGARAGTR